MFFRPGGSDNKESACNAEDPGLIPGSGRSPGEGNGDHSSILAWRTPWAEEPGGLRSVVMTNYQAPLSMGFSRQEYWSGLPFPSPCCKRCVAKGVAKKKARLTLQQRGTMKENSELFYWKHSVFSLSFHILFLITELGADIALTATPLLGKPQIPTPI